MPTAAEYERLIAGYGWQELQNLWAAIETRQTPGWEPGKALEYLVLRAFQLNGADVVWPYSVREDGQEVEQIDGVVYWAGLAALIECKDEVEPITAGPINKMRSQLLRRPAGAIGLVFSHTGFTRSARTLARFTAPQTVLLWDGERSSIPWRNRISAGHWWQNIVTVSKQGCRFITSRLGEYDDSGICRCGNFA